MLISLAGEVAKWIKPLGLVKKFVKLLSGKEEFFSIEQFYDYFSTQVQTRVILEIPGRGCAWYKNSGGCTMCGFGNKLKEVNTKWNFSDKDLVGLYKMAEVSSRSHEPKWLYIYNGGSFLNLDEVPLKTQIDIACAIRKHPTFFGLFVESRPEFIQEETIIPLLNALGIKFLKIGIGLEAVTDQVREVNIHKGFSRQDYEQAVELVKSHNARILTYVFLKPLGLSEKEAIEEAVRTIFYAFEKGSDEVSLSCAFIQEGTKMERAYQSGKFRPPWLWSIIEVVRRTANLGPVRIGSFEDKPLPIAIPHNCSKCDVAVMKAIRQYNLSYNLHVFDNLKCDCQIRWEEEK